MTLNEFLVRATGWGFPKMPYLLETERVHPRKGADTRALFEPLDLCVGVSKEPKIKFW